MGNRLLLALFVVLAIQAALSQPALDKSRARKLENWKPQIQAYSKRHYGEDTWQLEPTCIVLHYTAGKTFPWNLVNTDTFAGEAPGLASHYVIDGTKVWELVPPTVRSRGAFGINHRALNIEMVAADAADLANRPATLKTCAALCRVLMAQFDIPLEKIYSHQDVSKMDKALIPEVLDRKDPSPYHKIDPGAQNMKTVLKLLKQQS
jgi:N-acetyl-anhydromuramyl-L-alanine amidase AmpD